MCPVFPGMKLLEKLQRISGLLLITKTGIRSCRQSAKMVKYEIWSSSSETKQGQYTHFFFLVSSSSWEIVPTCCCRGLILLDGNRQRTSSRQPTSRLRQKRRNFAGSLGCSPKARKKYVRVRRNSGRSLIS